MSQFASRILEAELALRRGESGARRLIEQLALEVHETDDEYHDLAIVRAKLIRSAHGYDEANEFIREHLRMFAHRLSATQERDVWSTIAENERILGRNGEAWRLHFQLMKEGGSIGDLRLWTWAVLGLARIAFVKSQFSLALRFFADAAHVSNLHRDIKNLAWALRGIADTLIALGDTDDRLIEGLLRHASRLFEETGHLAGELWTLQSFGDYCERRGLPATSLEFYRESMVRFHGVDGRGRAFAAAKWGLLRGREDNFATQAAEAVREASGYFQGAGIASGIALVDSFDSRLSNPRREEAHSEVNAEGHSDN